MFHYVKDTAKSIKKTASYYAYGESTSSQKKTAASSEPEIENGSTERVTATITKLAEQNRIAKDIETIQKQIDELTNSRHLPISVHPNIDLPAPSNHAVAKQIKADIDTISEEFRDDCEQDYVMTFPVKIDDKDYVDFVRWLEWCEQEKKDYTSPNGQFINPHTGKLVQSITFDSELYKKIHEYMTQQVIAHERQQRLLTAVSNPHLSPFLQMNLGMFQRNRTGIFGLAAALGATPGIDLDHLLTKQEHVGPGGRPGTPVVTNATETTVEEAKQEAPSAWPNPLRGWW